MVTQQPLEQASLLQLQQTPVENVLQILDEGLVHLPSYRELYYRWERQQWISSEIDFSVDRQDWEKMSPYEHMIYLYALAPFFQGEDSVAATLSSYIIAFPDDEMRLFAMTQQVDEARHTIFFSRFFSEVVQFDRGKIEQTLSDLRQYMTAEQKYILIETLDAINVRLRAQPDDLSLLVEAVTLYHVIVEGMVGLAGMRVILDVYRKNNIFPGFRGGFTAVTRDESRHVVFGVKFLREMIQRDHAYARVVQATIEKYVPAALQSVTPPAAQIPFYQAHGMNPWDRARFARESLQKKLKVIGLSMDIPAIVENKHIKKPLARS